MYLWLTEIVMPLWDCVSIIINLLWQYLAFNGIPVLISLLVVFALWMNSSIKKKKQRLRTLLWIDYRNALRNEILTSPLSFLQTTKVTPNVSGKTVRYVLLKDAWCVSSTHARYLKRLTACGISTRNHMHWKTEPGLVWKTTSEIESPP